MRKGGGRRSDAGAAVLHITLLLLAVQTPIFTNYSFFVCFLFQIDRNAAFMLFTSTTVKVNLHRFSGL